MASRGQRGTTLSAKPGIAVRPAVGGVEIAVRYVTRASERYAMRARLYQAAVQLLAHETGDVNVVTLPALFLGHGNPLNAIRENIWTRAWGQLGRALPAPRAILAVSAHWYIPACAVTAMAAPRTIHDFGDFPPSCMRRATRRRETRRSRAACSSCSRRCR